MESGAGSATLWLAIGILLVIEGFLPLVSPDYWRKTFLQILKLQNGQLRFLGLGSVLLGVALIWCLG